MAKSESYTVLARRYRPTAFEDVVGQEKVSTTLRNAIAENRVAHAYLFNGPRGVGKTTMARLFAKALNCVKGPTGTPCNACEICVAVHEGGDTDVVEMDAASNRSVEDARTLREGIRYAPLRARSKVYIIDEAHMLTREAFNTLLKTLEEPPPHVKFIFATTEVHKLPDTIVSRCQRFDFRRITTTDIVRRLRQVVEGDKLHVDDAVLSAIARAARGSMRDAESLLDQLISFKPKGLAEGDVAAVLGEARGTLLAELVGAVRTGDAGKVFASLAAIFAGGVDTGSFLDQLVEHFRALLAVKVCGKNADIVDLPAADLDDAEKEAAGFTVESLLYAIQLLLEAKRRVKEGSNPRIVLEVTLVKMARSADLVTLSEALRLQAGSAPPAPASAPARAAAAAPSPEEEEAPAPPAVEEFKGTPTNLQEAQGAWPRVYQAVKEKNMFAGTLLGQGRVTRFAAGEVVFTLASHFKKFHLDRLESRDNRAVIDPAVLTVFGKQVTLKLALEPGGGGPGGETPMFKKPAPPPDTTSDPGVKKILETFGGSKIVGIE